MVTLIINNSYCQLKDLSIDQYRQIRKILSYNISSAQAHFSGTHYNTHRYLIDKNGFFPTGLLSYTKKWICDNKVTCRTRDDRIVPSSKDALQSIPNVKNMSTPYPDQINAVETALRASRGTISMPTGTGKSLTMGYLVKMLGVKTLIIVPNVELKKQLTESFKTWFGTLKNVVIENIDSTKLKTLIDFDCLIIDECHHSAAKTYRDLNKKAWGKIYYRFCFSATPFRSRDEEQLLYESMAGDVIYRLTYEDAVQRGYIVPVEAYYVEVPPSSLQGIPERWASVYNKLVVNNEPRNQIIRNLLEKLHAVKCPTLCLVKEIQHGNLLTSENTPFMNGQDQDSRSNLEKFNKGRLMTLIGTTGVLGEGVDTKPAEVIIIAGLGKSRNAFMQMCGRGVRRYSGKGSCQVIIFKDLSHKWSKNHYREQCKILLEEYNTKPIKLKNI